MVLKILALIFFLTSGLVHSRENQAHYKLAQKYFKRKDFSKSLSVLRKGYNFKKPNQIPTGALFLIAYNYQKLNKFSQANYFYNRLIQKIYYKKNKKVMLALKNDELGDVEIPKVLGKAYYNLGVNYYQIFKSSLNVQSADKAIIYLKICDESDIDDKCSDLLEEVQKAIKDAKLQQKKYEFYVQVGRLLFQDRITVDVSSGNSSEILSNNSSICYGAGLRYGSALKGYDFSGCAFSGTTTLQGTVTTPTEDKSYKQSGVPIAGMLLEAGYYFKFDEQKTRLGIYLPILYRAGSYSKPTDSTYTYTIDDEKAFKYGISVAAGFQIPIFELQLKLAHMEKTNLFNLNILYNF